jgi:phosphatidylglycerophosphate synthase
MRRSMLGDVKAIYFATRKKNDQLWNTYVMRPIAAAVVAVVAPLPITPNQLTLTSLGVFVTASALFVALPTWSGGIAAVCALELSYLYDCADGMLARHKKIASKTGHLFDFFTDELKATLLAGALALRLYRQGGYGIDLTPWPAGSAGFLIGGIAGVTFVASAISLTNFVRRPELSGRETPIEAHYESLDQGPQGTQDQAPRPSLVGQVGSLAMTFLRFLNHYPSHLWIFALLGRLDAFYWMYVALNLLYLARGWLGLALRFGRS